MTAGAAESAPAAPTTGDVLDVRTRGVAVLLSTVLLVAICGIVYELLIATVSSYLLGNSVVQFSITIGVFMFAMGVGSYITRWLNTRLIEQFVAIELTLAAVGGLSTLLLFAVFPYTAYYRPVMITLILAVGVLVGLEIPILTRILTHRGQLRDSIAHVLALDYFGALLGAVGFPLLLLPMLGLFEASFCIGLLNAGVALVNVAMFRTVLRRPILWFLAALGVIAVLIAALIGASALMRFAESRLYTDRIIYLEQTPYQRIVLTENVTTGRHRLYLDGHLQFAEWDEYRYHEALVHPVMSLPGPREQVLVLGGGDGMAAREVLRYGGVQRIDLVDIDPAMTQLCATYPRIARINGGALDDPRVHVHHEDAFSYLREATRRYDRIIIDLPDPHNEALAKLYSVEFYRLVGQSLRDDGWFVTQSSSPWLTRQTFWSIGETIAAAGMDPLPYHVTVPTFSIWGFQLAGKQAPAPRAFDIQIPTRFLNSRAMEAAQDFPADMARSADAQVNSIFQPGLYMTYQREINR